MPTRRPYSTDLSDEEWEILEPLVPDAKPGGRPRAHETRELLNAIFYVLRGGCPWRLCFRTTSSCPGRPPTTTSGRRRPGELYRSDDALRDRCRG